MQSWFCISSASTCAYSFLGKAKVIQLLSCWIILPQTQVQCLRRLWFWIWKWFTHGQKMLHCYECNCDVERIRHLHPINKCHDGCLCISVHRCLCRYHHSFGYRLHEWLNYYLLLKSLISESMKSWPKLFIRVLFSVQVFLSWDSYTFGARSAGN